MRIALAYNLKTKDSEDQAELITQEDADRLETGLRSLGHRVVPVEVSGRPNQVVDRLLNAEPDLVFNVAEGTVGAAREAFYPGLYEQLGLPFTGGDSALLHLNLDKHLAKTVLAAQNIRVPQGSLLTPARPEIPKHLEYPLFVKPNAEGSSKGISQRSVVENEAEASSVVSELLEQYPAGIVIEEFISGRELSVPMLEAFPGRTLEIVEHTLDLDAVGARYNIFDYASKRGSAAKHVDVLCPAPLDAVQREAVLDLAKRAFSAIHCVDLGRVDIRLREDGVPFFIELNPLPSMRPQNSLMTAAKTRDLEFRDVLRLIVRSAARRFRIPTRTARPMHQKKWAVSEQRPGARAIGLRIGRLPVGVHNAITDVKGVKVGHSTHIEDDVELPGVPGTTAVRTGMTVVLPGGGNVFDRRVVAGGFVLNGIGEMSGLTQVLEWGWIETPIILTNTVSVPAAHEGAIKYMTERYPKLRDKSTVIIPVVGECNDWFLNDIHVPANRPGDVRRAISAASSGAVEQGSVGAGTGMISFDYAGGIGTSSRVLPEEEGGFTIGALVLANCGKLRNLTIGGAAVGRELDRRLPVEGRRVHDYGSVIVVLATDAPLLSGQLNQVAKRGALGLGRVGSHARSSSGEILIAFSTANRVPREEYGKKRFLTMRFISSPKVNSLYEAALEVVEEAMLNAIFCSSGMRGRGDHAAPAIPHDEVLEILRQSQL